jgi:hypothetical protein
MSGLRKVFGGVRRCSAVFGRCLQNFDSLFLLFWQLSKGFEILTNDPKVSAVNQPRYDK